MIAGASLAGGAVWCGPGLAVHWPPLARALNVPLRMEEAVIPPAREGAHGEVALTYDDGPHPEGTPAILEALRRGAAKATFFLVGEQVERYPELAARIVEEGHEPAVHAFRHRNQMRLTPRELATDLDRARAKVSEACGRIPLWYRPPYGVFTLPGLAAVRRRGLKPLLWSKWGRDWRAGTPSEIVSLATRGVAAGDVILLHDADWYSSAGAHRSTAAATPAILEELRRRGLTPVRLPGDQQRPG